MLTACFCWAASCWASCSCAAGIMVRGAASEPGGGPRNRAGRRLAGSSPDEGRGRSRAGAGVGGGPLPGPPVGRYARGLGVGVGLGWITFSSSLRLLEPVIGRKPPWSPWKPWKPWPWKLWLGRELRKTAGCRNSGRLASTRPAGPYNTHGLLETVVFPYAPKNSLLTSQIGLSFPPVSLSGPLHTEVRRTPEAIVPAFGAQIWDSKVSLNWSYLISCFSS